MADLRVVELDFDNIKDNLKTFLQNQDYFTDYDFEGSAMSIILDMLAYDTHYKAYLANMVINERFIDTAVKRASVVSHAKTLGYVPRSARAAKAVVNVTVYGVSPTYTMSIDKFTPFVCDINNESYTFITTKSYTASPSGDYNAYVFEGVELYEGTPITYNHQVQTSALGQLFKIPATNVDTSTLSVVVQNSASDTISHTYTKADFVSSLTPTDRVYYLEEGTDGYYYVYFGDGVLGKAVESGNIVKLTYITTQGSVANTSAISAQTFYLYGNIGGYSSTNTIVEVMSPSNGGAEKQDIDEIRFLAPKNYSTQGRTITSEDYKSLLVKNFPEIDSISVWGGEDNIPPIYGKVFIAIKPTNGFILNTTTKDYIRQYLKKNSIVSMQYDFVDPDFTFITVNANLKFDSNKTIKDSSQLVTMTTTAIQNYFAATLQQFDHSLYVSKLHTVIDNLDDSILGNTITLGLQKRIEPVFTLGSGYTLYFNNRITPYSVLSSAFNTYIGNTNTVVAIKDIPSTTPPDINGTGSIVLFELSTGKILNPNLGTINYATGLIVINSLRVSGYPSLYLYDIRVNCTPQAQIDEISNSIATTPIAGASVPVAMQNQILMLDDSSAVSGYNLSNGLTVTATPL